jgi:death-on-curing protein
MPTRARQGPHVIFIHKQEALELHARAIEQYGGSLELRDEGGLESALMAAENRHYYEEADLVICAATYAYHIAKSQHFVDGNKRTAALVTAAFIYANDATWTATEDEIVETFLCIGAGELTRDEVEERFRGWIHPFDG